MLVACQLCVICVFYFPEQLFETKDSAHDNRKFSYLLGFLVVAAMEAYLFSGHERSLLFFSLDKYLQWLTIYEYLAVII